MRLSTYFVTSPLLLALAVALIFINNAQTAIATADVYFYEYDNGYNTYKVYSYNHNDDVCDIQYDDKDLHYREWVAVNANKDHESTIQTVLIKEVEENGSTTDYQACDGYATKGACHTEYQGTKKGFHSKAKANKHYIFFPGNETICMAATNSSNGDVLYDDNNLPIGICNDCSEIYTNDNNYISRFLLRGGK